MKKLQIDIGSTYFKTSARGKTNQYFRNFDIDELLESEQKATKKPPLPTDDTPQIEEKPTINEDTIPKKEVK
jgi:hypothetical protein